MLVLLGLILFVSTVLLPLLVTLAEEVVTRWRYRHVPGPPQSWLMGNLRELVRAGLLPTVHSWICEYGKIFKMRIMGRLFVVVSDPDAVRTLMTKVMNRAPISNPNANLVTGEIRALDLYGIVMAKDDYWRMLRTAWQPAFSPASLRGYQALMDREALALVARLEGRLRGKREQEQEEEGSKEAAKKALLTANGGSDGCVTVEVLSEMSRTTLAVVGTAAFGVDFTSPEYGGSEIAVAGSAPARPPTAAVSAAGASALSGRRGEPSLVQACSDFFRTMGPSYRSKWAVVNAFPRFLPLLREVASAFPDATLAMHIRSRQVIGRTAHRLIRDWRDTRTAPSSANGCGQQHPGEDGKAANTAAAAANAAATAAAGPQRSGVAPGSFLGLMLAARDKAGGRQLSDIELVAQVETFMLAGFETTANALTFALYHLALNPGAANKLREEVDRVVPPLVEGAAAVGTEPLTVEVLDKLVYTEAVIQEAMRLHPPAHAMSRCSDRPLKVLGYDIPAGTSFFIPIALLHKMGDLWPDAQAFRPERFMGTEAALRGGDPAEAGAEGYGFGAATDSTNPLAARHPHAYLPFGAGPRMCIGWRFAIQEAKTVLARLFQRFHFELVPGQVPLELSAGITLAPKHGVMVRLTRRAD